MVWLRITAALFLITTTIVVRANSQVNQCSFAGPPKEQAGCLLRHVHEYGIVDRSPIGLPEPLNRLIGERTANTVTKEALLRYLTSHHIAEQDIGGLLSNEVSKTSSGEFAAYFIIHDTSTPTLKVDQPFPPAGMDTVNWAGNKFEHYLHPTTCSARRRNPRAVCQPVAHVFINRLGDSRTGHDFNQGWRSTKYET